MKGKTRITIAARRYYEAFAGWAAVKKAAPLVVPHPQVLWHAGAGQGWIVDGRAYPGKTADQIAATFDAEADRYNELVKRPSDPNKPRRAETNNVGPTNPTPAEDK